jgi:hypothetical protein
MKTRRQKRQGILFITTLIVSAVVAMMMTAALVLLPSGRSMANSVEQDGAANAAALAGLEYARTQLQHDPGWRADGDMVTVDDPGHLWIREHRGNVIGILWSPQGNKSLFQIRFNYQNGLDTPDEARDDPASDMIVAHPYVSYNHLDQSAAAPMLRGDSGNYEVTDSSSVAGEIPRYTAVVYCQGLAGPGLRDVTPSNLTPDPSAGKLSVRTLETFLGRDISAYGDAVVYGADDISVDLTGKIHIRSEDANVPPRVRTLASMGVDSVDSSPVDMVNGEVYVEESVGQFLINSVHSTNPVATQEDSSGSFIQLGWEDLDKPLPADATMKAGTYVWKDGSGGRRLEYYAQDYDPLVGVTGSPAAVYTSTNISTLTSVSGTVTMNASDLELRFSKNVNVVPEGSATGLAIIPDTGLVASALARPKNSLAPPTADAAAPIISATGDIQIEGTLQGQGSVTTQGSLKIQGNSIMEADPDGKVALFAKEDIVIDGVPAVLAPIFNGVGGGSNTHSSQQVIVPPPFLGGGLPVLGPVSGSDVGFKGVVYAQGDVRINLDNGVERGNLYLQGVLVAYGGDYEPLAGQRNAPGSGGNGIIDILAKGVDFRYDSSYIAQLRNQASGIPLDVVSWRSF